MLAFELAQLDTMIGKNDRAAEVLFNAWRGDRSFREAMVNAWILAILADKKEYVDEIVKTANIQILQEPELSV
jgi:thioredoxin-like negative regulator of GroEL